MKRAAAISFAAVMAVLLLSSCTKVSEGRTGNSQSQRPLFAPAPGSPIPVAGAPDNVAISDVNSDGKSDLVVACGKSRTIAVLLGQGNGQFRAASGSPFSTPENPHDMVIGDVNGDGRPDVVLANHDSYNITLLVGDGKGSFALAPSSPVKMKDGSHPHTHGLGLGDLNGDGKLDLVTANNEDNDVAVAFGDGHGGFTRAPGSPFAVNQSPYPLALADLNDDGHMDIAVTSTQHGYAQPGRALTLLTGDGRGSFRRSQISMRTVNPWSVAVGDVNGDRHPDIVATHWERSDLTLLIGDGKGVFNEVTGSPFNLGRAAWRMTLADVNRDGKPDVLAAAGDGVVVMLGDGRGSFKPANGSPFPAGKGAWRVAVGDVNGDGKPDMATSNLESDSVSVLLAQ